MTLDEITKEAESFFLIGPGTEHGIHESTLIDLARFAKHCVDKALAEAKRPRTKAEELEALKIAVKTHLYPMTRPAKDLPPGVCQECDGDGEQGGQFCGGYWKCEACGGTGKTPAPEAA